MKILIVYAHKSSGKTIDHRADANLEEFAAHDPTNPNKSEFNAADTWNRQNTGSR
jgi:putative NADPH-quinone reductase